MQTFLPHPTFSASAACLDRQRLGKQRVEVLQILKAISDENATGWRTHPATLMWKDHRNALVEYGLAICDEWIARGYRDTCREKILAFRSPDEAPLPPWLGIPEFHAAHRSNLIRKEPAFYRAMWDDPGDLPYLWPTLVQGEWKLMTLEQRHLLALEQRYLATRPRA